jgi:F0F1-type ATP synthase alpha subunit
MSTPAQSRLGSQLSQFTPKIPANVTELLKQGSSIKDLLKQPSTSPPTPLKTTLNQLIKGCQIAMHNGVLLRQEIEALRAEHTVQKQKRARTKRNTAYQGGVSV